MCEDMPKRFTITEKWDNKDFRNLSPEAKLLFLYICDKCDIAGFWEIDLAQAAFFLGISGSLDGALQELANPCPTVTDGILWVKNFVPYQGNWPLQPNAPAHGAIVKCLQAHNGFQDKALEYWTKKTGLTLAHGLPNPLSISKGKGKGKGKEVCRPNFETFWNSYPRKEGKGKAWESWRKNNPPLEQVLKTLEKYERSEQWKDSQFIPMPATWLNQWRWEDEPEALTAKPAAKPKCRICGADGVLCIGRDWYCSKPECKAAQYR
jgi:hypothetical protein